ncbi:oligopeptide/dipeptide ABC transporter ATP-binding protein [Bosea sp. PAMC 26642]|uniref:oligopeptide/dipeptide ABC transporter ATP-binding protein n=1 Tax=Bosea sp. (strain PAMC 26642) TaxID=1792307 RepID=UPI0007706B57|nr:oligopeptide/dipeptide ABC transporter ATP-binding protein [Bosea sp. PAMC 26642]AMJ61729.1 peptide ABC transporter ATP-binding protein [Bosea sp. PAMC 26642]
MVNRPLIDFSDVAVVYNGQVRALDGISLAIERSEIVGLVGESGSGKTTLCRVLMGLVRATSGTIAIDGELLATRLSRDPLGFRRQTQMLLQDAVASLSPRMRIRALVEEPLKIHGLPMVEGRARLLRILKRLGLPETTLDKFPHQVSGGQARRVAILRALVLEPQIVVADEPTAGLDVSVQGDLLNLMRDLHEEFALTYLVVSHNLNVVRRLTNRTVVMYLGQIVEEAPTKSLFEAPAHPYTSALLSTNPSVDPARRRERIILKGEIPSPINPPSGCRFHTRCPQVQARCSQEKPLLRPTIKGGTVRCHFPLTATQAST